MFLRKKLLKDFGLRLKSFSCSQKENNLDNPQNQTKFPRSLTRESRKSEEILPHNPHPARRKREWKISLVHRETSDHKDVDNFRCWFCWLISLSEYSRKKAINNKKNIFVKRYEREEKKFEWSVAQGISRANYDKN